MITLADIEADGLKPTKIHVICTKEYETGKKYTFTDMESFSVYAEERKEGRWVFHNGLGYDVPVINKLVAPNTIPPDRVIDTAVVSRTVKYNRFITHSLDELGEFLGVSKDSFSGPWDVCSPDMIKYCEQDVEVLEAVLKYYWKYITDSSWHKALRVEHDMAIISNDLHTTGFPFNRVAAEELLSEVKTDMALLEDGFKRDFPPTLVEQTRIQMRYKKDGTPYETVTKAKAKYPCTYVDKDGSLVCMDYQEFNPGSPKQRIDKLWEAGWKPVDKTVGHKKFLRGKKR